MLDNFFKLPGTPRRVKKGEFLSIVAGNVRIENLIFDDRSLGSDNSPFKRVIDGKFFYCVSFKQAIIKHIEFSNCVFDSCLFLGCIFKHCRFRNTRFITTNVHRIELDDVFVDPRSFDNCVDRRKYQNIGLHLYQALLNNSKQLTQPDFESYSYYQFRRWYRFQLKRDFYNSKIVSTNRYKIGAKIVSNLLLQIVTGHGVRGTNFAVSSVIMLIALTLINWTFHESFGLSAATLIDSFYFTSITVSTVGFGDIVPMTECGRVFVAFEGLIGFFSLATLASVLFRKLSP